MFPLQPNDELVFQISFTSGQDHHHHQQQQQQQIHRDPIIISSSNHMDNKRHHNSEAVIENNQLKQEIIESSTDGKEKRIVHRNIERQRRLEMAKLHASLRLLLPLQYVKGKRSISDHTHGAVSYINQLQKRITELGSKRERLKKLADSGGLQAPSNGSSKKGCSTTRPAVTVSQCCGGLQILIVDSSFRDEGFPLSRILKILLAEGLEVVSCVSTKVKERLFHTIQLEVRDKVFFDLSELQNQLTDAINM